MLTVSDSLVSHLQDVLGPGLASHNFISQLLSRLESHPHPQKSLNQFERILNASLSKVMLIGQLNEQPELLDLLLLLILKSDFYADNMVKDPHLFSWLVNTRILGTGFSRERMEKDADRALQGSDKADMSIRLLKQFQRKYLVAIGVRDLTGTDGVKETTSFLSALADVILIRVAGLVNRDFFGGQAPPDFAVFALGKHGGAELNYSSDIDLMAICASLETTTWRGSELPVTDLMARWVQRFVDILTRQDDQGQFYRVDFRLRPDGEFGPLVPTGQGALNYYFSRGRLWERQMLLKIRPVFGDETLISSFLEGLRGFIFNPLRPVYGIEHLHQSLQAVHENQKFNERNIKTTPGGIRSIEFLCQTIQLEIGQRVPDMWCGNTLDVLDRFAVHQFLQPADLGLLREAYCFYRQLEHHLQVYQNQQTHELPKPGPEFNDFATRFSKDPPDQTEERIQLYRQRVSDIIEYYFPEPKKPSRPDHLVLNILSPLTDTSRRIQETIVQFPYQDLTRTANAVDRIFKQFPNPASLATLWVSDATFLRDMLTLADRAPVLIPKLLSIPELWELLVSKPDSAELLTRNRYLYQFYTETREALLYLTGRQRLTDYGDGLAQMMKTIISSVFSGVPGLSVIAVGKVGSGEPSPGSDADLIALSHGSPSPDMEQAFTDNNRLFSVYTPFGTHFQVDYRLRPEGKSSPMIQDDQSLDAYFLHRADYWEFQTWLRARLLTGDEDRFRLVLSRISDSFRTRKESFTGRNAVLRQNRLVQHRTEPGSINLKKDRGGILDIEITIQHLALMHLPDILSTPGYPLSLLADLLQKTLADPRLADLIACYQRFRLFETEQKLADTYRSGIFSNRIMSSSVHFRQFDELRQTIHFSSQLIDTLTREYP